MNEQPDLKLTDLDYLIGNHHLQMMKAALPYMNVSEQRLISLFVKMNELNRTMALFRDEEVATMGICSVGKETTSPMDMLNAIKPYATTYEQDFIDLITNFIQGSKIYNSYQSTVKQNPDMAHTQETGGPMFSEQRNPLEQIKNFLPPEQQSKLETIQVLMQAAQTMT